MHNKLTDLPTKFSNFFSRLFNEHITPHCAPKHKSLICKWKQFDKITT